VFELFRFNKLLGLDIGNGSVKACEVSANSKTAKLTKFQITRMNDSAYKNGEILNPAALTTVLKSATDKVKAKKVSMGVSGSSVMVKKITIPKMDEALLPEQVRWEAEQYIPYNIDEVNIEYIVLSNSASQDTMDLLLVAAQQSRVGQFVNVVTEAGLKPEIVDVSSFALANCFNHNYPEMNAKTVALIDMGAFFTHFVVVQNGEVIFSRDIPAGGQLFDEDLAANLGVPVDEARQIKESEDALPDIALDTLKSVSKRYSEQVVGAMEFFVETTQAQKIKDVFLTGGASLTIGLIESLTQGLKSNVQYMNVLKNITPSPAVLKETPERDLQYKSAVAIGLALRKAGDT
jgi:type IV pilus assembly protein PilM